MIDFLNKEFPAWLRKQLPAACVAIAVRAALRASPALSSALSHKKFGSTLALPTFRCLIVGHASAIASNFSARAAAAPSVSIADIDAIYDAAMQANVAARGAVAAISARTQAVRADATILAVSRAAKAVAFYPDASTRAISATEADVDFVESGVSAIDLSAMPLWPSDAPGWAFAGWEDMMKALPSDQHWDTWLDWYKARLVGEPTFDATARALLRLPDHFWERAPAIVNAQLKRELDTHRIQYIVEDLVIKTTTVNIPGATTAFSPAVPTSRPAALQPIIEGGRLRLPKVPARSDLKGKAAAAALRALKHELTSLADDIGRENNIDRRVVSYLQRIANDIPERIPRQHVMFQLAHQVDSLEIYGETVNNEWPILLAARYHATLRAYDQTMRQFPSWREFKRHQAEGRLSKLQIENLPDGVSAISAALRQDDIASNVDRDVPNTLDSIAKHFSDAVAGECAPEGSLPKEIQSQAADVLESANNTIKEVAQKAMEELRQGVGEISEDAIKELRRKAKEDLEASTNWAYEFMRSIAKTTIKSGASTLVQWLSVQYPTYFAWLSPVVAFLASVESESAAGKSLSSARRSQ
jgi:hypothetical protein